MKNREPDSTMVYSPDRPGCVTAYALLLWLVSGFLAIRTLSLLSDTSAGPFVAASDVVADVLVVIILVPAGIGLWRMRLWGWWIAVITHILVGSVALLSALPNLFVGDRIVGLVDGVIAVVSGSILYWLITNRHQFSGSPAYRIVAVVLAVFLLPICVIAFLSLLGPNVGDVFSRIVQELSTP